MDDGMSFEDYGNMMGLDLEPGERVAATRMALPALMRGRRKAAGNGTLMRALRGGGNGDEEMDANEAEPDQDADDMAEGEKATIQRERDRADGEARMREYAGTGAQAQMQVPPVQPTKVGALLSAMNGQLSSRVLPQEQEGDDLETLKRKYMPTIAQQQEDEMMNGDVRIGASTKSKGVLMQAVRPGSAPQRDAAGHYPWAYSSPDEQAAILKGTTEGKSEQQIRQELTKADVDNAAPYAAPGSFATAIAAATWKANNPGHSLSEFYRDVLPKQRAERGAQPVSLNKAAGPNDIENLQARAKAGDLDAVKKIEYLSTNEGQKFGRTMYGESALLKALKGSAGPDPADMQQMQQAMRDIKAMIADGVPPSEAQAQVLAEVNALRRH